MSTHPAIEPGTRVKATMRRTGKDDYTAEAIAQRALHDGHADVVSEHHDAHGSCYGVTFEDERVAFFDPEDFGRILRTARLRATNVGEAPAYFYSTWELDPSPQWN